MPEESPEPDVFKERLKQARQTRKLQQGELATKSGLPAASISHFESGSRKPSFDNLRRLAHALEVTTDFLLGRVEQMERGTAGDPLYRHMENLTGRDREIAEDFLKALAGRSQKD